MVSGAVASTRSRSSSRLVAGVVGSRSGMETNIAGRCFGVGFVGMLLDDDMRMPHERDRGYGLERLSSLCNHISIIFLYLGERGILFADC